MKEIYSFENDVLVIFSKELKMNAIRIIFSVAILTLLGCSNGSLKSMKMKDYQQETTYQEGYYTNPGNDQYDEISFTFSN